ncbi:hypothetical protein DPEC_G00362840 [Dallia pectoralis]|nr:hypothetical protein DPEC_G00362840 [Dallia pectoralis]
MTVEPGLGVFMRVKRQPLPSMLQKQPSREAKRKLYFFFGEPTFDAQEQGSLLGDARGEVREYKNFTSSKNKLIPALPSENSFLVLEVGKPGHYAVALVAHVVFKSIHVAALFLCSRPNTIQHGGERG